MSNPVRAYFDTIVGQGPVEGLTNFSGWLRASIVAIDDESLTLALEVREDMCSPAGSMHGGVMAAVLDEVIGMLMAAQGAETHFVSLNLTVDFLRPAFAGQRIKARSQLIRKGRTAAHFIASITGADGKEVARCTQNMVTTGITIKH